MPSVWLDLGAVADAALGQQHEDKPVLSECAAALQLQF